MSDLNKDKAEYIAKAMSALKEAIPAAEKAEDQPLIHFHAPAQWMNDPNGPIYYQGWFHLFYQFNPFGDHWGNMHWGHARSRDLVNWEYLPIALWPSKEAGEDAIFSGSCHLVNGVPAAFYTSIGDNRTPEQWMAKPDDKVLIEWSKVQENPILKTGPSEESNLQEWRDPFFFDYMGSTYMLTGGGEEGRGIVALHVADDRELTSWQYKGILFTHPDEDVANVECPNFAKVDGKWVLLVSVHGRVESFVGSLTAEMRFESKTRDVLCPGSYASQLLTNKAHDVLHLAWVPTEEHRGWNGLMTLPSKLSVASDGKLHRTPIPALRELRGECLDLSNHDLVGREDLTNRISGDLLEVIAVVEAPQDAKFEIDLRLSADRSRKVSFEYPLLAGAKKEIHLFLDRSVAEEYIDNGAATSARKIDCHTDDKGVSVYSVGGTIILRSLKIYKLHPARFSHS